MVSWLARLDGIGGGREVGRAALKTSAGWEGVACPRGARAIGELELGRASEDIVCSVQRSSGMSQIVEGKGVFSEGGRGDEFVASLLIFRKSHLPSLCVEKAASLFGLSLSDIRRILSVKDVSATVISQNR